MGYAERVELYRQIEEVRERPLIIYVTSSRSDGGGGRMGSDVIPMFCEQILRIPTSAHEVDVLIVSEGGDPIVSWRIISMLRERFDNIGVLLPYHAYSAATLLALGADEIIMHPFSNLGPVDPQLHVEKNNEGNREGLDFAAEDLSHFIEFVQADVGITDQEQKERAFELLCKEVGTVPIGAAKRSSNLALSLGEKLLSLHMDDQNKVRAISEALNKSFYHHGYPVGRAEAKKIGLPIIEAPDNLETLIWNIWTDLEEEMRCNEPFNPFEIVMADPVLSQQVGPVPQIQVPANLPPDLLQQVYQQFLQNVHVVPVQPIYYEFFNATVESTRIQSNYRSRIMINAIRNPDLNININVTPMSHGWKIIQ